MKKLKFPNWKKHGFEFLSIFIAVISAFALNNWNENRKAAESENKILTEISNGLKKDLEDIHINQIGQEAGIAACNFFRDAVAGKVSSIRMDSLMNHYINLTRDFVSIQNTAGYQTLKSRGLELIQDDSLRLKIISLYEYDFNILRKLEEEYYEMQFQENYFMELNRSLAPNFNFDENGMIKDIQLPLQMEENRKKEFLLFLFKIQGNRSFILTYYDEIEKKVKEVEKAIRVELKK